MLTHRRLVTPPGAREPWTRALEAASTLLTEAAHDLRSPLTGIREAVRLVRDGEAGALSGFQRELLSDAIDHCDAIEQLAEKMLRVDRLGSGLPAVHRRWLTPREIAAAARATLAAVANRRGVRINWHGFDAVAPKIFADPELLRRLLANLVGNAVEVSPPRANVLVGLTPSVQQGMMRLSVADHGPGLAADQLETLATRGRSQTGGTGLGLDISRTLAALHFGRLLFRTAEGEGTRVSLELPAGGPASVAHAFGRWRDVVAPPRGTLGQESATPSARNARPAAALVKPTGRAAAATQAGPLVRPGWFKDEFVLPFAGESPRFPPSILASSLQVAGSLEPTALEAIDRALQSDQRLHELVYRTHAGRWVVLWDCSEDDLSERRHACERTLGPLVRPGNLRWLASRTIAVTDHGHRGLLHDILVRSTLWSHRRQPIFDKQAVRGPQLSKSVAEARLDAELRHLSRALGKQSQRVQQQARRIGNLASG
jgi:hypothetical protein